MVSAEVLERVASALASVPREAYSVPHDYPAAAPVYAQAPLTERPNLASDRLRLYVHVPFCRYRCSFCQFAVRVESDVEKQARYVRALERELEWIEPGTALSQLFVGGGTPTALPPELLGSLLDSVFARTRPFGDGVHTVETSPETISAAHVDVLKSRGVGRISMGIQSLDDALLGRVQRRHSPEQALGACELIVGSGLIVNVDLIYGLPGQTEQSFARDLGRVAGRGVPAVTLYSLRINERTRLGRDTPRLDLARLLRWRAFVKRTAEELGYAQTRFHTFKRSIATRHERLPTFDDSMSGFQLGIGMSARSQLGHAMYRNHDRIETYLERIEGGKSPVEQVFHLEEPDRMTQLVARTLGDGQVLTRARYESAFGRTIDDDFGPLLDRLRSAELVEDDGASLRLSELGGLLHDLVTLAFYPPKARAWLTARLPETVALRRSSDSSSAAE